MKTTYWRPKGKVWMQKNDDSDIGKESVREEAKRRNIKMSKVIGERIKKGEYSASFNMENEDE